MIRLFTSKTVVCLYGSGKFSLLIHKQRFIEFSMDFTITKGELSIEAYDVIVKVELKLVKSI